MANKFSSSIEVTIKDFKLKDGEYFLKNNGKKGLLLIYAPWCGYCQMLAPEWKRFYTKHKDNYVIKSLNVENKQAGNNKISEALGVQGFPTIKTIETSGKITKNFEGERNIKNFEKYLSGNNI